MALLILSALGGSMFNVMMVIGIVGAPRIGRVVRGSTLSVKNEEFVLAAAGRLGFMIRQAREYIFSSPYPMIFPELALVVTIIGFNLLGDGLRDLIGEKAE